jgi:hypothetical protein
MRVPFIRVRKMRGAKGSGISAIDAGHGVQVAAGDPVSADQAASAPLPRRRPGSHAGLEVGAVTADPAASDPATLRKVVDGLNRI